MNLSLACHFNSDGIGAMQELWGMAPLPPTPRNLGILLTLALNAATKQAGQCVVSTPQYNPQTKQHFATVTLCPVAIRGFTQGCPSNLKIEDDLASGVRDALGLNGNIAALNFTRD